SNGHDCGDQGRESNESVHGEAPSFVHLSRSRTRGPRIDAALPETRLRDRMNVRAARPSSFRLLTRFAHPETLSPPPQRALSDRSRKCLRGGFGAAARLAAVVLRYRGATSATRFAWPETPDRSIVPVAACTRSKGRPASVTRKIRSPCGSLRRRRS